MNEAVWLTWLVIACLRCPSSRRSVCLIYSEFVFRSSMQDRARPLSAVKIEDRFFDLAALLKNVSLNGEASSTCMEPQGIVEDAFTRRRGVM